MAFYNRYQCQLCGASLDPGEKCDCLREKKQSQWELGKALTIGNGGQLYIRGIPDENIRTTV